MPDGGPEPERLSTPSFRPSQWQSHPSDTGFPAWISACSELPTIAGPDGDRPCAPVLGLRSLLDRVPSRLHMAATPDPEFNEWARRWMELATFSGNPPS